jgi:FkbM family methyltransferase
MIGLWKPWFVHRPSQVLRRALASVTQPPPGYSALSTSWGGRVVADADRTIGRSIRTTGLYDLTVSEILARLIEPGDTVVDAGANIGYMSVLAARLAGERGRVLAFEPHPALFDILRGNVANNHGAAAPVTCHGNALGGSCGKARLQLPTDFAMNDGVATVVGESSDGMPAIEIEVITLDAVLGADRVGVLKLDVEGYEVEVLRGAATALRERRIRHIVFEDHNVGDSAAVRLLQCHGYALLALGWSMRGPVAAALDAGRLASRYEAPSYLATIDLDEAVRRIEARGWRVLRVIPFAGE